MASFMRATLALALAVCVVVCCSATEGATARQGGGSSDCDREFVPQSTAIPCPKTWADRAFLVPHEAIRMLSQQLVDAVSGSGFDPVQRPWQGPMLRDWYREFYYSVVHHHHDVEERLYLPFMEQQLAAVGVEVPQLTRTSHVTLLRLMDAFRSATEALAQGQATQSAVQHVRDLARRLRDDMIAHLNEEEELYPPMLEAYITEEQDKGITQEIIQDLGLLGNKAMLPPILEALKRWSGPKGVAALEEAVPGPIKFLLHNVWVHDMALNSLACTRALASGERPPVSVRSLFMRHAEVLVVVVLCVVLAAGVWAACRAPSITNPRARHRKARRHRD